jgi:methionyl-tRNA formyltransferase
MSSTLVIATPHARYDDLERRVASRLPGRRVVRLREARELTVENLASIAPEYVFLPHWSSIIPAEVHSRFTCVIFHMTDLPYGRGGSPLQNLIVRGHADTQLSALRCVAELDAGPVYLKRPLSLEGTAEQILARAAALMEDMVVEIADRRPQPVAQQGEVVAFKRRGPQDGNLELARDARQVYDFVRMLDAEGYPRAFVDAGRFHLEFSDARFEDGVVNARVRIVEKDS